MTRSEKSPPDWIDFDEVIVTTPEDVRALRLASEASQRMTTDAYLRFLRSLPPRKPDRTVRGVPGDQLEL